MNARKKRTTKRAKENSRDEGFGNIDTFPYKEQVDLAVKLLRASGIQAFGGSTLKEAPEPIRKIWSSKGELLWVPSKDSTRADQILDWARAFARPRKKMKLPPDEGTPEFLDMLIHDCRQYLMIATGEIKSIEEEGTLELDDPTSDLGLISIRLKRLKAQCMRQAGLRPLDWEHHGGLSE